VSAASPAALEAGGFARMMAPFAPFESSPALAVAVSGGRDSMALALLAHDWASARGGQVLALIVDHQLRRESADEAAATLQRLAGQGIAGVVLAWSGPKPPAGVQEAARAARYRLLRAECRRRGILHLLVAHHAGDQAETVAMRAARASSADGLAGMAAVIEFPEVRLLRPLLPVTRAQLTATLVARGMQWIDDPSNEDPRFERARLRLAHASNSSFKLLSPVRGRGWVRGLQETEQPSDPPHLTSPPSGGEEHERGRAARERRLARAVVETVEFDEAGQPAIDRSGFERLDGALQMRLLSRLVQRVGGRDHPPRRARLERAAERLARPADRGRSGREQDFTFSQCRLMLRRAPASHRLCWLVRPEKAVTVAQPLVPAAFFACGATATAHLE
jgi:tRNA(Ile)-lysidine synthase